MYVKLDRTRKQLGDKSQINLYFYQFLVQNDLIFAIFGQNRANLCMAKTKKVWGEGVIRAKSGFYFSGFF